MGNSSRSGHGKKANRVEYERVGGFKIGHGMNHPSDTPNDSPHFPVTFSMAESLYYSRIGPGNGSLLKAIFYVAAFANRPKVVLQ